MDFDELGLVEKFDRSYDAVETRGVMTLFLLERKYHPV